MSARGRDLARRVLVRIGPHQFVERIAHSHAHPSWLQSRPSGPSLQFAGLKRRASLEVGEPATPSFVADMHVVDRAMAVLQQPQYSIARPRREGRAGDTAGAHFDSQVCLAGPLGVEISRERIIHDKVSWECDRHECPIVGQPPQLPRRYTDAVKVVEQHGPETASPLLATPHEAASSPSLTADGS